jgi:hypothetical protein
MLNHYIRVQHRRNGLGPCRDQQDCSRHTQHRCDQGRGVFRLFPKNACIIVQRRRNGRVLRIAWQGYSRLSVLIISDALPLVRAAAQIGFPQETTYLAVLTGAVEQSLITNIDAFSESYQIIQRATSTAASKAINQLAVRFAAGRYQLAQLVRKDQDLSLEGEHLDQLILEAVSKEPSLRDADNERQFRDRLRSIASERAQVQATLNQQFPDYVALATPRPLSVQQTQQLLADDEAFIVYDFGQQSYAEV